MSIGDVNATITPMGWQEVADAVVNRRVELGMRTRRQLADTSGLTVKTLGEIERAERTSYDPATLATVEQALKWAPGTVRRILDDTRRAAGVDVVAATPDGTMTVVEAKHYDPPFPDSYMPGRARERVARLLDPDGPLDQQTRDTLAALICNACDLVDPPTPAAEQLRNEEALRRWERTAASASGPRREPRGDDLPGAVRRDVVR